ncbi:hypothetical protein IGI04_026107, partial [Brassica rapa subsp. trilocularis]
FFITWFPSSTPLKVDLSNLSLIFSVFKPFERFFRSGSDFGRLLESFLKYNALEVFNQMVLIFYLDISGSHFENLMGSLLRSLLKYNAKSLLMESSSIPSGVQACRRGMIYDSFRY